MTQIESKAWELIERMTFTQQYRFALTILQRQMPQEENIFHLPPKAAEELERRIKAYESGEITARPADEVLQGLRKKYTHS